MNPRRAFCAGFPDDLDAILREAGTREPLADLLLFVEPCDAAFEAQLTAALAATADRFGLQPPVTELAASHGVGPGIIRRALTHEAVALLARLDDLALGALYAAVAASSGATLTPELAGTLRALVIQARAARVNGWEVWLLDAGG